MNRFVADASVMVKLVLNEPDSPSAVRAVYEATELAAPDFLWAECANVLWKRCQRNELHSDNALEKLAHLMQIPVTVHASLSLVYPAMELALSLRRTVYDSLYLSLAVRLNIPLLTADRRLFLAVQQSNLANHVRLLGG